MARINNLTNFITDVANAIKTKSEISRTITPSEFDTLINNIQTGKLISKAEIHPVFLRIDSELADKSKK